jgi:trk system potassium uptake protein TrkH
MHFTSIAHVLGLLLVVTGSSMFVPAICSLYYGEADLLPIIYSALITMGIGLPSWWFFRGEEELNIKDGIFIAVFGWVLVSALSGLPFMFHGAIPSFTDAFFEMMSGYTTTGATILTDIESVPHGLLFWRSETHFLGGMGFLTLTIIFLPKGMGGLRIFRAESSPGQVITKEKFKARNRDTMVMLWLIYTGLNALQILLLWLGNMPLFDAIITAFGTVSTSGYFSKNASIGHYNNAYFDWVTTLFMFLGGMTFILFYQMMRGDWNALKINTEFRWYVGFILFFSLAVSFILFLNRTYGPMDSLRYGTSVPVRPPAASRWSIMSSSASTCTVLSVKYSSSPWRLSRFGSTSAPLSARLSTWPSVTSLSTFSWFCLVAALWSWSTPWTMSRV